MTVFNMIYLIGQLDELIQDVRVTDFGIIFVDLYNACFFYGPVVPEDKDEPISCFTTEETHTYSSLFNREYEPLIRDPEIEEALKLEESFLENADSDMIDAPKLSLIFNQLFSDL